MINLILSRRNIIIKEILELSLKNNTELKKFSQNILTCLIKIKNLEQICKFLIFINRKNYFGIYCPLYNKNLKKILKKDDSIEFLDFLKDSKPSEIYQNTNLTKEEIKIYNYFLELEVMSYLFFYEKRLIQYDYLINETNLESCKREIYLSKNVSLKHKYFEEKLEREITRFLKQNYQTEIKILMYSIYQSNHVLN